jgi:glycosyltransferase involved in cell wall biosynthesis
MRIGILSTRLSGTDGVSLEVAKWVEVLRRNGHEVFFCAGELGGYAASGRLIPKLHFSHPDILALTNTAFQKQAESSSETILNEINVIADELKISILAFVKENRLDALILQNVLAIPMNLPLAKSLSDVISETGIQTISHNHDYYWERERFQTSMITDYLETYFPIDLPVIKHVSINSIAQARLKRRRGIDSVVIPNVFDFNQPLPERCLNRASFRKALRVNDDGPLIIQPTRVIQRKGIEMAIELVGALDLSKPKLFITHAAGDEGLDYWHWIEHEAKMMGVELKLVDQLIKERAGNNIFSLADAYLNADLVTYPSIYEGFGNALVEAVYYQCPVVVNRYPVYNSDIRPLGFQFIELNGYVDDAAVQEAKRILQPNAHTQEIVRHNFENAKKYFSMEVLEEKLLSVLKTLM